MFSFSFSSSSIGNNLYLYNEGEIIQLIITPGPRTIFSDASINNNNLKDIDGLRAESPRSYLAPDSNIEALCIELILKNSSEESTMSDNEDDESTPKRKSIAHHFMPSRMVVISFSVETRCAYKRNS